MYFQKRKKSNKYEFIYYDRELKKPRRLSVDDTPNIETKAEAEAFCKNWEAQNDAYKHRIKERLKWEKRFHNFKELIEIYERARKEDAPNSYEDNLDHMRYYILPFFLEIKKENNVNKWSWHFEEFREWLKTVKPIKFTSENTKLAYSTMNNIVWALNAFMKVLYDRRLVDEIRKCRQFASKYLRRKSQEVVIDPEVQDLIFEKMKENNQAAANLFMVGCHTGMRLNELMGLSLADFYPRFGKVEHVESVLKPFNLKPLAYISIDSQPVNRITARAADGTVPRKPLKGRKDMNDCRIIPIFHEQTKRILVRLYDEQNALFEKQVFGRNPKNYLLFDGLTANSFSYALRAACTQLKLPRIHSPHDLRHTFATLLLERAPSYALAKLVLGHSSEAITSRYLHLNARIKHSLEISNQLRTFAPLKLKA